MEAGHLYPPAQIFPALLQFRVALRPLDIGVKHRSQIFQDFRVFRVALQIDQIISLPVPDPHARQQPHDFVSPVGLVVHHTRSPVHRRPPVVQVDMRHLRFGLPIPHHLGHHEMAFTSPQQAFHLAQHHRWIIEMVQRIGDAHHIEGLIRKTRLPCVHLLKVHPRPVLIIFGERCCAALTGIDPDNLIITRQSLNQEFDEPTLPGGHIQHAPTRNPAQDLLRRNHRFFAPISASRSPNL